MLFMSANSYQDGVTTSTHIKTQIKNIFGEYLLITGLITRRETTDGCAEQYHFETSLLILFCLAHSSSVIIDRAISSPGCRKMLYVVLMMSKKILIDIMNKIQVPEVQEDNNRIAAHCSTADGSVSLAK